MAASGPENLTTEQILTMCRGIFSQFEENETLRKVQGLLRVAGGKADTDRILDSGIIPEINKSNVHTVLDAVKRLLPVLSSRIADAAPDELAELQSVSHALSSDDDATVTAASSALIKFIDTMAESGNQNKEYLAEILYGYIHFATIIKEFSDINKMTSDNCAIVLGPKFDAMLDLVDKSDKDIMAAAAKIGLVNDLVCQAIDSGSFDLSFASKYIEQLMSARQKGFAEASIQAEKTSGVVIGLMDRLHNVTTDMDATKSYLDSLLDKKSAMPIAIRRSKQEKKAASLIKSMIKTTKAKLGGLEEKLQALQSDMHDYEMKRTGFVNALNSLRDSMSRLEDDVSASASASASGSELSNLSDSSLSSDEEPLTPEPARKRSPR
tara:strand:- start:265432 stop:266574 length:1143 start_codon:yes stop_codon:yes gene_type:complete